jgi:hypothetical protein
VRRHRRQQRRIAVRAGFSADIRGDRTACAAAVFDDDILAEAFAHFLGDDARGEIGGAAWRHSHDKPQRA